MTQIVTGPQWLIRARLRDALSLRSIDDAIVEVEIRSAGGPFRPCPFPMRRRSGGEIAITASVRDIAARLETGVETRIWFLVSRLRYTPLEHDLVIPAADFTPTSRQVTVMGQQITQTHLKGAPFEADLRLMPRPVRLAGLVLRDNDPQDPVVGAQVTIDQDAGTAVATDPAGRFLIPSLPLRRVVTVTATESGASVSAPHTIDFTKPTNALQLSFITAPAA